MTLGERIKTLRTEKNITQEKLAEELNVSRSAIAKWESDGGVPEIINLEIISGKKEDKLNDKMFKYEPNQMDYVKEIDKAYFAGKKVNIDIAMKEGIISGFFDERSDDYKNVTISGIDESMVNLEFGVALDIAMIAKIEEIDNKIPIKYN